MWSGIPPGLALDVNTFYNRGDGILAVDDFVLGVSHSLRSWVLVEMETMSEQAFLLEWASIVFWVGVLIMKILIVTAALIAFGLLVYAAWWWFNRR
ncbi:hypothetical protein ES707_19996 [subsurface metagenome]